MRRTLSTLLPALLLALPAGAQTGAIDFRDYRSPESTEYQATIGAPVTAGGLDFYETSFYNGSSSRNVLGTWGTDADMDPYGVLNVPSNLGPSAATLFATALGVSTDIFGAGADPVQARSTWPLFNLYSIDVAHLYSSAFLGGGLSLSSFTMRFFATHTTGSSFFQDFVINLPPMVDGVRTPVLRTLTFDERFRSVNNVWFYQGARFEGSTMVTGSGMATQFTNVTTTPEPATVVLFGTGLLAIGAMAHRRRRAQS